MSSGSPSPDITIAVVAEGDEAELERTLESLKGRADAGDPVIVRDLTMLSALVEECQTPYLMLVRSGELVAPEALRMLAGALEKSPQLAVAHAFWDPLGPDGRVSRLEHRAHSERLRREAQKESGKLLLALPTFRVHSLRGTNDLRCDTIDDFLARAAGRLSAMGAIALVPRTLSGRLPSCAARAGYRESISHRRIEGIRHDVLTAVPRPLRSILARVRDRTRPYEMIVSAVRLIPGRVLRLGPLRGRRPETARIGYAATRYPLLTETFIRRELNAVHAAGIDVEVFAIGPDDPPMPADTASPAVPAFYYGPIDTAAGRAAAREFLRRRPLRVIAAWLYIVRRSDHRTRTWWADRDLLFQCAQLASVLARRGVTHVHSPWASRSALLSYVASRLIGATFSVHARANEVLRHVEAPALFDRIAGADFVIVNSRYMESVLLRLAHGRPLPALHVVYNGVELERFVPVPSGLEQSRPVRLITVGRLVEPKGFRYLLAACAALRDRGLHFTCEIIGAPDREDPVTWIELRRMHAELSLERIVTFRGALPFSEILAALESADIMALPCVEARDGARDVTPNVLLEAMAMALPVVSTPIGAIPEMVDDGHDGLLVTPRDEAALAGALERLMTDAGLRSSLGAAAREKIERRFDSSINARRLCELFAASAIR